MTFSPHQVLACIEIVVYVIILFPAIINLRRYGVRQHTGWLFMLLFCILKIAGSILYLVMTKSTNPAIGIQVTTQIIYSIALGPLLAATLSFFNGPRLNDSNQTSRSRSIFSNLPRLLRLIHYMILTALTLGIAGGVERAPKSSNGQIVANSYDQGASLLKVASILFLVSLVCITYGLARYWAQRSVMPEPQRTLLPAIAIAIPLLFLRVIYSMLGGFNLDTTTSTGHTTTFNMLTGSWVVYLFLAMLPQIGVVIGYSIAGFKADKREAEKDGLLP